MQESYTVKSRVEFSVSKLESNFLYDSLMYVNVFHHINSGHCRTCSSYRKYNLFIVKQGYEFCYSVFCLVTTITSTISPYHLQPFFFSSHYSLLLIFLQSSFFLLASFSGFRPFHIRLFPSILIPFLAGEFLRSLLMEVNRALLVYFVKAMKTDEFPTSSNLDVLHVKPLFNGY